MIRVDAEQKRYMEIISPKSGDLSHIIHRWNTATKTFELKDQNHTDTSKPLPLNLVTVNVDSDSDSDDHDDKKHYTDFDGNSVERSEDDQELNTMEIPPRFGQTSAFHFTMMPDRGVVSKKSGRSCTLSLKPTVVSGSGSIVSVRSSSEEQDHKRVKSSAGEQSVSFLRHDVISCKRQREVSDDRSGDDSDDTDDKKRKTENLAHRSKYLYEGPDCF
jgi:hypothetical protein